MNKKTSQSLGGLIGESPNFLNVLEIAEKIASHKVPILIEGERGAGKKWLARSIHFASPRKTKEFIALDCAFDRETVLESELFGYVRGSFAGAINHKKGLLELADGGTVCFNEVSKLKPSLQLKLNSFLSEESFYKLGGVSKIQVDVRVIASCEENLSELVKEGLFREDLFYRISAIRLHLPPLRERGEDVILLAHYFLKALSKQYSLPLKRLGSRAEKLLLSYHWPGNIAELEQEIRQAFFHSTSEELEPGSFSLTVTKSRKHALSSNSLKEQKRKLIEILEKNAIVGALKKTKGNRTKAADILDVSRQELIRKIAYHKIKN